MFGPSYRDFLQKVGWTKICDPDFEMTEEVYQELETYGLSRQLVDAMRAFNALPQRERAVRSITNNITVDEIESRILNDPQQYPHNIRWPLSLMDEAESANLIRQQSER